MDGINNVILQLWKQGRKTHTTPSGWIGGNAPCCNDKRGRGGLIINPNNSIAFSCFNCGFKAKHTPGNPLSNKMKRLLTLLGANEELIQKLVFIALKDNDVKINTEDYISTFHTVSLPQNSKKIKDLTPTAQLLPILEYIHKRNLFLEDYEFYYSPHIQFKNRLIIPFFHEGNIVGYTGRRIDNNPHCRYLSSQQPNYLFNLDNQKTNEFIILTEGVIDAISLRGVALLGSNITKYHDYQLKRMNKEIIFVPDQDKKGMSIIEKAIEYEWKISIPQWSVKDINEGIKEYGRLGTLWIIKEAATNNYTKILLRKKELMREYETKS